MEAQLLVALALGVSRTAVTAQLYPPISPTQKKRLEELTRRRENRVPFAYLRGTQEFYGREFLVSPATLIPRPETEALVDFALEKFSIEENFTFADVGTGSGCIGITLLCERANSSGVLIDLSEEALSMGRKNASILEVDSRAEFRQSNLLSGVLPESFNLIVSNPPYIPTAELTILQPEVARYEPEMALDGGADGLELYRVLILQARVALKPGGWLAVEIGQGQALDVEQLFRDAGFLALETRNDLAGIGRIVVGQKQWT